MKCCNEREIDLVEEEGGDGEAGQGNDVREEIGGRAGRVPRGQSHGVLAGIAIFASFPSFYSF